MPPAARLEVGRVGRAHGLRGEVTVVPITNRTERFVAGAVFHSADRVLTIATARPHAGAYLVRFEGVDDRTAAEELRGTVLRADPLGPAPPGEVWVHEVIGRAVCDRSGHPLGRVVAVEANPAHDLIVLDSGALIPMVFVVDTGGGAVVVDLPDGLLDL